MSKQTNRFIDYVNKLSFDDLMLLEEAINQRKDYLRFGFTNHEDAAIFYKREPRCPYCGNDKYILYGKNSIKHSRYICKKCNKTYSLLSDSIFNSSKLPLYKLASYIELMTYNVPLSLMCDVLNITSNTANLWRKKIFSTIDDYQEHLILSDKVWIDEIYVEDSSVLVSSDTGLHLRGLSKTKLCIVVAIDNKHNMIAKICGHGKPSSKRIYDSLKDNIKTDSLIIHDGERAHEMFIEKLSLSSEVYKANTKDKLYLQKMRIINNMCGWFKRYIFKHIGMNINNLQSYLNWYIYLLRCKRNDEKWPKVERIIRHLLLERVRYTRK